MTKAIEAGMPKAQIEAAAARRQAAWDRGEEVVVGVNKYRPAGDHPVELLEIDTTAVREAQIRRLAEVRAKRDERRCQAALDALTEGAAGNANLLELGLEAARARATLGEISSAIERVFGRWRAEIRTIAGVYGGAFKEDEQFMTIQREIEAFAEAEGRRPRLLVAKLGQDGHDRGAKVIATAFADIGFDVDIGALFQTPEEAAREAIENDVHVIGVSTLAAGHKVLVPELIQALRRAGGEDILVVVGGVVPSADHDFLQRAGVAAIYPPGTNIPEAASEILELLRSRQKERAA
jgi:methylmalonyl-CoA mutase